MDERPQTWRADPVKTFFAGIALGLMPLVVLAFVALVLL